MEITVGFVIAVAIAIAIIYIVGGILFGVLSATAYSLDYASKNPKKTFKGIGIFICIILFVYGYLMFLALLHHVNNPSEYGRKYHQETNAVSSSKVDRPFRCEQIPSCAEAMRDWQGRVSYRLE